MTATTPPAGRAGAGTRRPAPVVVVAGAPGTGKSTIAARLLDRLHPVPAILDKDVLYAGFVAEVQAAHGRPASEREGPWHAAHVKVHEYQGMRDAARQVRTPGCPAMLVAPFTSATHDAAEWEAFVAELGGEPVVLVWVTCSTEELHARLVRRARSWDADKLRDFDAFVAATMPDRPPPVPHTPVDTTPGSGSLEDALRDLSATWSRMAQN